MEDTSMSQDSSADIYFDAGETWSEEEEEIDILSDSEEEVVASDEILDNIIVEPSNEEVVMNIDADGDLDMTENGVNNTEIDGIDATSFGEARLPAKVLKPRNYQLEMLEESLKRNIIVAMDTGSGKTHIAVLRIAAELERAPRHKLIWFMAPTVALCEQQHRVLSEQLPAVQVKFFSSNDNVDRWTTQELWDAVLLNVRVVVSTYQILLDALTHAFVRMESIALLVFDEAHNCVKSHPGSQMMKDFYMPKYVSSPESVPHILGLSASPIMNSNVLSLSKIEETLNAICRTPSKHRAELLQQVKLPDLRRITYSPQAPPEELVNATVILASLHSVYKNLDIMEDPYVVKLKAENTEKSVRNLKKAFMSRGTYIQDQFKSLCLTSTIICHELGGGAADFYVSSAISKFTNLTNATAGYFQRYDMKEKLYLATALGKVDISPDLMTSSESDKVQQFINTLLEVYHPEISAVVFVKTRAAVAVLAHILSVHPKTKDLFNIGTFVGTSQDPRRVTNIGDMIDTQNQWNALNDFRNGILNLIVSTSALEEGIDVPSCNIVLCFNEPDNLKVLVQRRGRARSRESMLVIMDDGESNKVHRWLEFEKYMKQVYEDDMRVLKKLEELENLHEPDHREFRVESTG